MEAAADQAQTSLAGATDALPGLTAVQAIINKIKA